MSFSALAVTAVVLVVGADLVVLRTRMVTRPVFWLSYAIILAFQLIVNGVLTGRDVVVYDPAAIWGPRSCAKNWASCARKMNTCAGSERF